VRNLFYIFLLFFGNHALAFETTIPSSPPDSLDQSCDTLWLKSGKIMLVSIISENGSEVKFTSCPPNDIVSTIPKSSTKLSPRDSSRTAKLATLCDTIYLKGGEIITGHMKYYTSRKVVYTGCCQECITEKLLKRKDVDSILYANGRRVGSVNNNEPKTEIVPDIENNTKTEIVEPESTPREKESARKRMKLYGILGLSSLGVAVTAAILLFAIVTVDPIIFGLIFFAAIIAGLGFAMGYVRKKRKAGLQKKKGSRKRNKS
jgi:hypothetical protein